MSQQVQIAFFDHFSQFRSIILALGGERYPQLVKRWCNFLMGLYLVLPFHEPFFHAPPTIYGILNEYFGYGGEDMAIGWFMIAISLLSWSFSFQEPKTRRTGHWWVSIISCVLWAHVMTFLWSSLIASNFSNAQPIHFIGFVALFTSFFVPLRMTSERRVDTSVICKAISDTKQKG